MAEMSEVQECNLFPILRGTVKGKGQRVISLYLLPFSLRQGSNGLDSSSATERSGAVMLSAAKHLSR
ncbi:MAG: hypothetical protein ACR2H5_06470, partial [Ktedonobacteraceae bacterium]